MTKADSIIKDLDVAVEFARQIFPLEVQQSMVGRRHFEVFQDGIHGAVKGLYSAYEVGLRLSEARREEVCRCENRGFKHGWIKALQTVEVRLPVGIDSASPLYHRHFLPYSNFEIEKSDDEVAD